MPALQGQWQGAKVGPLQGAKVGRWLPRAIASGGAAKRGGRKGQQAGNSKQGKELNMTYVTKNTFEQSLERFAEKHAALCEFIEFNDWEKDALYRESDARASRSMGKDEAERQSRLAAQISGIISEAQGLTAELQHSFPPIEAKLQEDIKAAKKTAKQKGREPKTDEKYGEKMLRLEQQQQAKRRKDDLRRELEMLRQQVSSDIEAAKLTLPHMVNVVIKAWKERGPIDAHAAFDTAVKNTESILRGLNKQFDAPQPQQQNNTPALSASAGSLPAGAAESEAPITTTSKKEEDHELVITV
jgi:hypothetical protein